MFHKMNVKNVSKDLNKYPQISRRVRDTLARLFIFGVYTPWLCTFLPYKSLICW